MLVLALLGVTGVLAVAETAAQRPQRNYYVYVCAESDDTVHKLRFGPSGLNTVKSISVGAFPAETEGPHGITVSPKQPVVR